MALASAIKSEICEEKIKIKQTEMMSVILIVMIK